MANPVRVAIHDHLTANAGIEALVGDEIYFQVIPAEATYPLVVFHKQDGRSRWTMKGPASKWDLWTVKGIAADSGSAAKAEDIDAAIDAALQDAQLAVAGRDLILKPLREEDVEYPEVKDGKVYRHCGAMYRLVTE